MGQRCTCGALPREGTVICEKCIARARDLAHRSFNPLFDNRTPAAIAQCRRIEDVQTCVSAAAQQKTPIAARSGGHSYPGYSTPDNALIVDLSSLSRVQLNTDGTAVIGAGV